MYIQKYAGGKWRIRETKDGKDYSTYLDHKPTKAEARAILDEMQNTMALLGPDGFRTFSKAYEGYIEAKRSVLSPSTLKGYRTAFRGLPEWFTEMQLSKINRTHVQKLVNDYSVDHSPKTVKNQYSLVCSVMRFYDCKECPVTLPQAQKEDIYIPTKEDVAKLLKVVSGTKYEVPIRLGIYGLRRSEIMALTIDDLSDDNVLTIDKAMIEGETGVFVKTTKTTGSTRKVLIDDKLADLIRQQGYIYDGSASRLTMAVTAYEDAAGLPHFSLHKLRHFFASYMHELGYSEAQVMEAGGWTSDRVMKRIYRHAMEMDDVKKEMAKKLGDI